MPACLRARGQILTLLSSQTETWPLRVSSQQVSRRGLCAWGVHMTGFCGSIIQGSNLKQRKATRQTHREAPVSFKNRLHQVLGWSLSQHWRYDAFTSMCDNRTGLTRTKVRLSVQEESMSFTKTRARKSVALPFDTATCRCESLNLQLPLQVRCTWLGKAPLQLSPKKPFLPQPSRNKRWETKHYSNLFAISSGRCVSATARTWWLHTPMWVRIFPGLVAVSLPQGRNRCISAVSALRVIGAHCSKLFPFLINIHTQTTILHLQSAITHHPR